MLQGLKMVGAGISTIALGGACIGAGIIFGQLIAGISRNPSLKGQLFPIAILGFGRAPLCGIK